MSEKRKVIGVTVGTPLSPSKIKEKFSPLILQSPYLDDLDRPCYILDIGKEYKGEAEEVIPHSLIGYFTGGEGSAYTPYIFAEAPIKEFTIKIIGFEYGILTYEYNGEIRTYDCSVNSELTPPYELQRVDLVWRGDFYLCNPEGIKGGEDGKDGKTPYIKDGNWWIGETDTGVKAEGKDGKDGINGIDGKDGENGKDGTNGVDGKDGVDGKNGADGKTPYIQDGYWYIDGVNLNVKAQGENGKDGANGVDGKDGADGAKGDKGEQGEKGDKGDAGADGKDGANGTNGKDGVSATHSWNGTTLTITSASGTSSADLKGDKGEDGADGKDGVNGVDGKDGAKGADGYTPIKGVDYYTEADKAEFSEFITSELAKRGQLKPEPAQTLADMTDTSLMYVLLDKSSPDYGYIFAYMLTEKEVESAPTYNNLLDDAINADKTPYIVTNEDGTTTVGYKKGWRINSSNVEKQSSDNCMTGYIPVRSGQTIRVKNVTISTGNNGYFHWYKEDFKPSSSAYYENNADQNTKPNADGLIEFNAPTDSFLRYFRMTTGVISDETIITVDEEITESGGTEIVTEYAWANTGLAFVPADYEGRIVVLEKKVEQNTADIEKLKKGAVDTDDVDALTRIRNWDAPIYDANIPVFQLSTEKAAMTNATKTPNALYAMYDALMSKYPHYITKTDLGICSDGIHHVYRYDFKDPEQRHTNNRNSETKAKAILVSGIHLEWAGMFGLYYALEEITENPALRDLRRNVHLIAIPCCNPFVTLVEHYDEHGGQQNANGVEVHRNFEAAFLYPDDPGYVPFGELHHGGTEPLSEVETQYIDNVLKENTDAAFFVTCHNFNLDQEFGISFIWPSVATAYMCNMGYRLIDKMSDTWMDKYKDEFAQGIESYRFDTVESWDTRLGHAQISASPGTETRQATKYGIQGANVEICERFHVHGTKENPEPLLSSFTMSRGAEVYINFLLTAFGVYDAKDKALYGNND